MNNLIPKINPNISKLGLKKVLSELKPDENIELLNDQVSWRFFHFWFTDDDQLASVTYGS